LQQHTVFKTRPNSKLKSKPKLKKRKGIAMSAPSSLVSWVLFLLGFALHFLLQAKASVSSRSNGLRSVREWIALTWPTALVRLFLCALAFGVWLDMPNVFNKLAASATGGAIVQPLPLNRETIALFGYLSDSLLDKFVAILGFSAEVPRLAPPN
jgi:hypothetical protein